MKQRRTFHLLARRHHIPNTALAYLQYWQNRYIAATHQHYNHADKESVVEAYEKLQSLVHTLLGRHLERSNIEEATLFGFPLASSRLSMGQIALLMIAVILHPPRDDAAILLVADEPENHLHPSAVLKVLDQMRLKFTNSQIWIATHSVPTVPYRQQDNQTMQLRRVRNRFQAHCVNKAVLARVTAATRQHAIQLLKETSLVRLSELRNIPHPSFQDGRENGLRLQQYANCDLYLRGILQP